MCSARISNWLKLAHYAHCAINFANSSTNVRRTWCSNSTYVACSMKHHQCSDEWTNNNNNEWITIIVFRLHYAIAAICELRMIWLLLFIDKSLLFACDCVDIVETNTICTLKSNFSGWLAAVASIVDMCISILNRIDHNNGSAIGFDTDIGSHSRIQNCIPLGRSAKSIRRTNQTHCSSYFVYDWKQSTHKSLLRSS